MFRLDDHLWEDRLRCLAGFITLMRTTGLSGAIYSWQGTSMAAPLVAAEAADILSAHTSLSATQVVQDIMHSTVSLVGVASMTA